MIQLRIGSRETAQADLKRIALELLDDALRRVRSRSVQRRSRNVHEVRKRLKEARGVIALLAQGSKPKRTARLLRDLGRAVAVSRDADSVLLAFDDLKLAGKLGESEHARVREALRSDCAEMSLHALGARIVAARAAIAGWATEAPAGIVEEVMARSYRAARRSMYRAIESGASDDFHQWRTRAKAHWYHSMLLAPVIPDAALRAPKLRMLSRLLGRHHDLTLLSLAIARHADVLGETIAATVSAAAEARRAGLEERAVVAGLDLFTERPREWRTRVCMVQQQVTAAI
jgi:hypothetical protein